LRRKTKNKLFFPPVISLLFFPDFIKTGYFVCSYMVLCNNVSPSDAIRNFGAARGHEIERQNYINDIMAHQSNEVLKRAVRMKEGPGSEVIVPPPAESLPLWRSGATSRERSNGRQESFNQGPLSWRSNNSQPEGSRSRAGNPNDGPPPAESYAMWRKSKNNFNNAPPTRERSNGRHHGPSSTRNYNERPPSRGRNFTERSREPPTRIAHRSDPPARSYDDPPPPGTKANSSKQRWSRWDRKQRDERNNGTSSRNDRD
jgi:hypothetical protein